MAHNEINPDIRCTVKSCAYHANEKDYCSLSTIHVDPCMGCGTGKAQDESMCGSYKSK